MTMPFGKLAFGGLLLAMVAGRAVAADDPYLWLEDIHGAKPMEWVKAAERANRSAF